MDDAIGAGAALAVGAAVIARGILREFAAGGRARAFERVGVHRREGEVARVRRAGERERAGQDEKVNNVSQQLIPLWVAPPPAWNMAQTVPARMGGEGVAETAEVGPLGFVSV